MKIEIEDRDYLAEKVAEQVLQQLYDRSSDMLGDALDKAVRRLVDEHANEMVREALAPKIAAVIAGDFGEINTYGAHTPRTIKTLIVDYFKGNNYHSREPIKEMVEKHVAEVMKAEFQPTIDAARKALRDKLDHILGEKVSLAVREAVGLR
jgi:hypothetical protein